MRALSGGYCILRATSYRSVYASLLSSHFVKCIAIVAAFNQQALQGTSAHAGKSNLYMAPALWCSFMLIAARRQVGEALLELENDSGPDDAAWPEVTDSTGNSSMDSIAAGGSEESKHDSASSSLQASLGSLQKPKMS